MKLYTRRGDRGETGLWGNERTSKASARIEAIGAIDELNAYVGLALCDLSEGHADVRDALIACQRELFALGADLANPHGDALLQEEAVKRLECELDEWTKEAPALRHFILPGGSRAAAQLQVARSLARRAERRLVALANSELLNTTALSYVNRLSDHLFAAARVVNVRAGVEEPIWKG